MWLSTSRMAPLCRKVKQWTQAGLFLSAGDFLFFRSGCMGKQAGGGCRLFYFHREVVTVASRLTGKKRKQIIADHIEGMSIRKLAEKYGVSRYAVECAIKSDPDFRQKMTQKKEQDTLEMLEYMNQQKTKAQKLLDAIIEALNDPEKLARANVRDLATAYGIIADKFIQAAPKNGDEILQKAREILGGIDGVIK